MDYPHQLSRQAIQERIYELGFELQRLAQMLDTEPAPTPIKVQPRNWQPEHADVDDINRVDDLPNGAMKDRIRHTLDGGSGHEKESTGEPA